MLLFCLVVTKGGLIEIFRSMADAFTYVTDVLGSSIIDEIRIFSISSSLVVEDNEKVYLVSTKQPYGGAALIKLFTDSGRADRYVNYLSAVLPHSQPRVRECSIIG